MPMKQTRRHFLESLSLAGTAGLLGARQSPAAEEGLETTSVRLLKGTPICGAPVYVAEELLRAEGFTDIRYVEPASGLTANEAVGRGDIDFISGFAIQHLQALSELPYDKWREYDAEDTIRFYALRMREAGFIKSSPQKIIADGTDWRFLNELKRELKA